MTNDNTTRARLVATLPSTSAHTLPVFHASTIVSARPTTCASKSKIVESLRLSSRAATNVFTLRKPVNANVAVLAKNTGKSVCHEFALSAYSIAIGALSPMPTSEISAPRTTCIVHAVCKYAASGASLRLTIDVPTPMSLKLLRA
jgi:hypothetical protein